MFVCRIDGCTGTAAGMAMAKARAWSEDLGITMACSMQWVAPPSPPPPLPPSLPSPYPPPYQNAVVTAQLRSRAWMQILRSLDVPDRNAVVTAPMRSCAWMHITTRLFSCIAIPMAMSLTGIQNSATAMALTGARATQQVTIARPLRSHPLVTSSSLLAHRSCKRAVSDTLRCGMRL